MMREPLFVDGGISGTERFASEACIVGVVKSHRTLYAEGDALRAQRDPVAGGVGTQERDRVLGPVGREHLGAAERGCEGGKPEPRAELEHAQAAHVEAGHDLGKRHAARPELRPVREELVLVEGGLVDQLVGTRRAEEAELPAGDRNPLFDQSAA